MQSCMNKPLHCIVVVLLGIVLLQNVEAQAHKDYWIWAGITPADAPADAELIIYQGNFVVESERLMFEHKGIYPSPLTADGMQLVFRLHELRDPDYMVLTIERYMAEWQKHGVKTKGIQLDFDSPSAKLSEYAHFLNQIRTSLSKELQFSITGLGTWMMDADASTLKQLHQQVDVVTYQLYVGRQPVRYPQQYLNFLNRLNEPFKVGLLYSQPPLPGLKKLESNTAFKGFSYFIQK